MHQLRIGAGMYLPDVVMVYVEGGSNFIFQGNGLLPLPFLSFPFNTIVQDSSKALFSLEPTASPMVHHNPYTSATLNAPPTTPTSASYRDFTFRQSPLTVWPTQSNCPMEES